MKIFTVKEENRELDYEYIDIIHVCNSHSLAIQKMENAALEALEKAKLYIPNEMHLEPGTDSVDIIEKIPTNSAISKEEFFDSVLLRFWVTEYEIETE